MSFDIERGNKEPGGSPGIEDFVAREHWQPIAFNAAVQAAILATLAALMSMPPAVAFSLMYSVTLIGAIFAGLMAPRMAAQNPDAGVHIARRCVASLVVSGLALAGFALTFDGMPQ